MKKVIVLSRVSTEGQDLTQQTDEVLREVHKDGYGLPEKSEYNKDVRTKTWSIYAQGGLSWATGVWYENVNAKKSYGMAPAVGG